MSAYYNPETYRKIIRNGEECWVYDWGKNADINSFNYMIDRWGGTQQKFFINGETRQYFLIDKQERTVIWRKLTKLLLNCLPQSVGLRQ